MRTAVLRMKRETERALAETELRERTESLQVIESQIQELRGAEQQTVRKIEDARAALQAHEKAHQRDAIP